MAQTAGLSIAVGDGAATAYAITGADGHELSGRRPESLRMKDMIREL
jgi:hypothetical protein